MIKLVINIDLSIKSSNFTTIMDELAFYGYFLF